MGVPCLESPIPLGRPLDIYLQQVVSARQPNGQLRSQLLLVCLDDENGCPNVLRCGMETHMLVDEQNRDVLPFCKVLECALNDARAGFWRFSSSIMQPSMAWTHSDQQSRSSSFADCPHVRFQLVVDLLSSPGNQIAASRVSAGEKASGGGDGICSALISGSQGGWHIPHRRLPLSVSGLSGSKWWPWWPQSCCTKVFIACS